MDELTTQIHDVVAKYGTKRMAADLGMSYHGLLNQLNPVNERPVSLSKFSQIVRLTGDVQLIQPWLDQLGYVAVRRTSAEASAESVLALALEKQAEAGDLSRLLIGALADGKICDDDVALLKAQFRSLETVLAQMRASVKAMHANGKSVGLRAV